MLSRVSILSCLAVLLLSLLLSPARHVLAEDPVAAAMVENLAAFRFDKLGYPQIQFDAINPVLAGPERPHRLLILPVQFEDTRFERFAGESGQAGLNESYIEELLFAGGAAQPEAGTLSHYFRHQSRGRYHVTGEVFPTVTLKRPLRYYGEPEQSSDGSWRTDKRARDVVQDALQAAVAEQPSFPWQDFDLWDPTDYDGDGERNEADGYLDHLVLVVAGKAQSSCHGLYKLGEKLTVNAPPDQVSRLTPEERDCANLLWPHRATVATNLAKGPQLAELSNRRGGVDLGNGLWLLDYNLQSEYTSVATFIHEFGHSLGLPDVYARQTDNSTGSWEAMSATVGPLPQELSAWSRTVLGWMEPCVLRPREHGGRESGALYLKTMNDWSGNIENPTPGDACDSAMVILPPKLRRIELAEFEATNGRQALYSGQGNDMLRQLFRTFDLGEVPPGTAIALSFDTWFEIESDWDYLYVEAARNDGEFVRLMPVDKDSAEDRNSVMPAIRGHEGDGSRPGLTGWSGDLDGDGRVESAPDCDPAAERVVAEDRIGVEEVDPCRVAQWIRAEFDLSAYAGSTLRLRFSYYTDTAAVEAGALIDNVAIDAIGFRDDFEGATIDGWDAGGFTLSGGLHELAVPHFYLLEYRDPTAEFAAVKNYDAGLVGVGFAFYPNGEGGFDAVNTNYRPGVVMWYYNGDYLWSQNEPVENGPGKGFLLVVDSTPQEFDLPGVPRRYYQRDDEGWRWYEFDESAQSWLRESYVAVMCFQRQEAFYSQDVSDDERASCAASRSVGKPPMEALRWENRSLLYGYTLINTLLPGGERMPHKSASTLFDLRIRDDKPQFRLRDAVLRNWHSADAPFALEPYADGLEVYGVVDGEMRRKSATAFAPVSTFSDAEAPRYLNPHLPFGGAAVPDTGFSFALKPPWVDAPPGSRVRVEYRWSPNADDTWSVANDP
ncbi:MAG: M6 family metalloprotease domain-containing protein [Pseudomonadota bacterium]